MSQSASNQNQFTDCNWMGFLKWKFTNFPSMKEARLWKIRFSSGPMTSEEFAWYVEHIGKESAISINKNRKRSVFMFYLEEWAKWLTFWSRRKFNDTQYDNYCQDNPQSTSPF